jgi:Tol biopolymer transport system component/tRNA A-37 threonylcarbamoyl transferase component Bud32
VLDATPEIGSSVLHYRILRAIGRGGMGVVYEAEDTKLGRRVALKFLPPELARDQSALERFRREARAASALNHPNICTIHAIEHWDGGHFIVMELLDGESIDRRIGTEPFTWDTIVEVGIQVADALAAAHQRGIVHRDIKPANILITRDGRTKVLDFGVAKIASASETETIGAATAAAKLTDAGTAVGTIAYMSPEQARGEEIDARSDLFSLAAVLYELATAQPAFAGKTAAVTFQQILGEESRRPRDLNQALPAKLEEMIVKGLEKDRDLRYQTAAELRGDLRRLKRDASSGRIDIPAASPSSGVRSLSSGAVVLHEARRHKPVAAVVTVLVVAVLAAAAYGVRALITEAPPPEPRPGSQMTLTNITTHGDAQGCGAITPDGKYVAYCTFAGELRVTQVATGATVVLGNYRGVSTFSPDGDYLLLQSASKEHPAGVLWMLPTLGGPARRVVTDIVGAPAVSPDGSKIAFVRAQRDERVTTVIIADADGSNERRLATTSRGSWLDYPGLSWSQDGRFLAGPQASTSGGARMRPVVIHADSGKIEAVGTRVWPAVGRTAWLPGNVILFSAPERPNGTYQFWTMKYPGGEAVRITSDARGFGNISVSPTADGHGIATIPVELVSTLWETNADATATPLQWTSGTREDGVGDIRPLSNGAVVYRSWDGTDENVWSVERPGATPRKLTRMPAGPPAVPADGRFVVFAARNDEGAGIWRMEPDGSGARALAALDEAASPLVTPDGTWVYFAAQTAIMRVPAGGGEATRVHELAYPLDISPDGRQLLVVLPNPADFVESLALLDAESGRLVKQVPAVPGQIWTARYGRRADLVAYLAADGNVTNLWERAIDGGAPRQLTRFTDGEIFGFGYSADRTRLLLGRGKRSGDVVLIRDFQ